MTIKHKNIADGPGIADDIEIMAPAGSMESLAAALKAGADSVYFGVDKLNMRSRSRKNFTLGDLPEISAKCRKFNVKSHLALNTVLYDEDLSAMQRMVDAAADAGISAVIVSDPAVMQYARDAGMAVHMSTQCNITNTEAVRFYSRWADVMVMARELTLEHVAGIAAEIREQQIAGPSGQPVRLEVFAHGALCMAVSGKCYLSLHTHNSSANRGACVQNCRRPYIVTDKKGEYELEVDNEYIMSAKDLCTIPFLDKVLHAGVRVLKIEGRGRSADYVRTTVTCYREAIEAIRSGTFTPEKIAEWENELASVYNRGFWDGYYLGRTIGEWSDVHGSKSKERKIYIGPCQNYYRNAGVGVFKVETDGIEKGDKIMIMGPTTGALSTHVEELRIDDQPAAKAVRGDLVTLPLPDKARRADKLYKIVPA